MSRTKKPARAKSAKQQTPTVSQLFNIFIGGDDVMEILGLLQQAQADFLDAPAVDSAQVAAGLRRMRRAGQILGRFVREPKPAGAVSAGIIRAASRAGIVRGGAS